MPEKNKLYTGIDKIIEDRRVLLEACKDALCFIQELYNHGISEWSGEDDLKAAIAKAETPWTSLKTFSQLKNTSAITVNDLTLLFAGIGSRFLQGSSRWHFIISWGGLYDPLPSMSKRNRPAHEAIYTLSCILRSVFNRGFNHCTGDDLRWWKDNWLPDKASPAQIY